MATSTTAGTPGPRKHEQWLRSIRFDQRGTQAAYDADREAVDFALARRDRLDAGDHQRWPPTGSSPRPTRRLCCLRGISTLTGFALAVELGDWDRFTGASIGAYLGLVPIRALQRRLTSTRRDHQDRQHPRPTTPGRGGLAPPTPVHGREGPASPLGPVHTSGEGPRPRRQPAAAPSVGPLQPAAEEAHDRQHSHRPRAGRLVLVPGHLGIRQDPDPVRVPDCCVQREEPTHVSTMSHQPHELMTLDLREAERSCRTPSCGNQPAHISLDRASRRHAAQHPRHPDRRGAVESPDPAAPHPAP